jgi:hypothetical protein
MAVVALANVLYYVEKYQFQHGKNPFCKGLSNNNELRQQQWETAMAAAG